MKLAAVPTIAVASLLGTGCAEERTVQFTYQRPPKYEIPDSIKRVGVAEFGGSSSLDKQWGLVAADRLAAKLDEYNKRYERYQLVDRMRLKAILDEQDLQLAIGDTASAAQVGKIADVQAMIYGTIKVTTQTQRKTRTAFDPLRRRTRTVNYTQLYCMANVNFTMDHVVTSKTLAAVNATREFDSEKEGKDKKSSIVKMMGMTHDDVPPSDQVVSQLIDLCIDEFLSRISPHEEVVSEKLLKGKSKIVTTGNKLAAAGDYAEALECYESAIDQNPDDHEAIFNAGAMNEAMGDLATAGEFYDRAFKIEPKEQYLFARKRARQESEQP